MIGISIVGTAQVSMAKQLQSPLTVACAPTKPNSTQTARHCGPDSVLRS